MDDAPEVPSAEFVQLILDARGPGGITVTGISWGSRFRIHHRVADRYRAGRILLAGDACPEVLTGIFDPPPSGSIIGDLCQTCQGRGLARRPQAPAATMMKSVANPRTSPISKPQ